MTWAYRGTVLDLEPRGPLPSEIYWRRRGLALGIAVVVIGIAVAIVIAFVSNSSAGAKPANAEKPGTAQGAANAPQAPPPGQPAGQPEGNTPGAPPPVANPESATPTAAVQPPPVLKEGDDCPDSTLAVKGLTNQPQYYIGDQPKFTMVVTNIGLVSCKRDVGAAVLAAYVYSLDNKRLWSNLDCAPSNETLVKTFTPGEQVTTAVTWTGMGSAPHCPLPRPAIGPGTYNLVVQLGNLRSQPLPFVLNQPPQPPGPVPNPGPGQAPAESPPIQGG
ncbi:hypothetical protein BST27_12140 [Mycobacterium intermedium]|uniref:DUF4232 domain-containing protein n=1 Tax=Mycobacterium intermedium TaxID=28445 RepID=A0A1E3SG65_MYCIE|nr:hypothetical protein BHQ20_12435 [Mycobacterium intermedium]OPE48056.1 hypothetical protein BV508_19605 [Mycobacterium intermedium]ORB05716.1 hypothetical protein BST27_12140 [Mycobacterium intermedium]